jgi:hypothetical protein
MQRITRPGTRLRLLVAVAAIAGFMVVPATGQAAFKFGAKLASDVQPSGAGDGQFCVASNHAQKCTAVMGEAYGRANTGHRSPKNGRITKIRIIANVPGSFVVQIVRTQKSGDKLKAKVVAESRKFNYQGQDEDMEPYEIESFAVSLPIKTGQRLAIKMNKTSFVRCSSGGGNTLLYTPPLIKGKAFRKNTNDEGCWLLIEAVANGASSNRVGGTLRALHN